MLHSMLSKIATEYTLERTKPFAQSEFGNYVRHDVAIEAKKKLIFLPFDLRVKASVGAGVWASIPWLGFFDPIVTETATAGFYVVYLINPESQEIFLSLNQGTTSIFNEYGETRGQEVLQRRAIDMAERIPEFAKRFDRSPIDLSSEARLPKGYAAGHAFGRCYQANQINQDQFNTDLEQMLYAYEELINRGGTTPTDTMHDEASSDNIQETRKYVLSRRIERAPNVRPRVLEKRGIVCEGCGLDPKVHLSYEGPNTNTPLEVHHIAPISLLAEGESRRYRIPEDFLVLCPTCHKVIHNQFDVGDVDTLRASITFRHTPKKPIDRP